MVKISQFLFLLIRQALDKNYNALLEMKCMLEYADNFLGDVCISNMHMLSNTIELATFCTVM